MRSKLVILVGIALVAIGTLFTTTQLWVGLELTTGTAAFDHLDITGQQLHPSLLPLALAALAAALVLTIAGRILRKIIGVLLALLGGGVSLIAFNVLTDPWRAASGQLDDTTGLIGAASSDLVTEIITTPFIMFTLLCGVALAVFGLLVVVLSGRWKIAGRKYQASNTQGSTAKNSQSPDRVFDWDSLSQGDDPSDQERLS